MVVTFEADPAGGGIRPAGEAPTLAEASRALPSGAYTTLRTYFGNRVVRLPAHVRRLQETAAAVGPAVGSLPPEGVRRVALLALRATGHAESRLRLTWSPPRLFVSVEPFLPIPAALYQEGVACTVVPLRRANPHAKDTRFIEAAARAYAGLPPGIHEGLMVGEDDTILEGLTSNFFALHGGELWSEEERALGGISRALLLDAAGGSWPVRGEGVKRGDLARVSEAFLTSASRGVLPVVRVDAVTIGTGRPGPVTRELSRRLEARVEREAEPLG